MSYLGHGWWIWLWWLLVAAAICVLVLVTVRAGGRADEEATPEELLRRRFTSGEIDEQEISSETRQTKENLG